MRAHSQVLGGASLPRCGMMLFAAPTRWPARLSAGFAVVREQSSLVWVALEKCVIRLVLRWRNTGLSKQRELRSHPA